MLRKRGFVWLAVGGDKPHRGRSLRQWVALHQQRTQSEDRWFLSLSPYSVWDVIPWVVLPTFMVGLPAPLNFPETVSDTPGVFPW